MSENEELLTTDEEVLMTSMFAENVAEQLEIMKKEKDIRELKAKSAMDSVPSTWKLSTKGLAAVKKSVALYKTEYGLYASIPMICKGEECVYADLFPELHEGLSEPGERCPVEVAMIIAKYDAYTNELDIQPEDAVDMSILRDVIDFDIQIMRAENKMAIEGDFVKDVIVSVQENGTPVMQEQITKAAEYKDKIQGKRNRALEMLNSTRKDKAGTKLNMVMDPSTYAKMLMQSNTDKTIEGDFEDLEVIPDIAYDKGSGH